MSEKMNFIHGKENYTFYEKKQLAESVRSMCLENLNKTSLPKLWGNSITIWKMWKKTTKTTILKWFFVIRNLSKVRITPVKLFKLWCNKFYNNLFKHQKEPVLKGDPFQFSIKCMKGWMSEFRVSLRKSSKHLAKSKEDREVRLKEYI